MRKSEKEREGAGGERACVRGWSRGGTQHESDLFSDAPLRGNTSSSGCMSGSNSSSSSSRSSSSSGSSLR